MAYKSKYKPKNLQKYSGNASKIISRSSWERALMKWCDMQSCVVEWSSEEVIVPYIDETTPVPYGDPGKLRRYFVDFKIHFDNGQKFLIEVKPAIQCNPPKKRKKTNKYLLERITYEKNLCKWKAASKFAKRYGYTFKVWTEKDLKRMGILVYG